MPLLPVTARNGSMKIHRTPIERAAAQVRRRVLIDRVYAAVEVTLVGIMALLAYGLIDAVLHSAQYREQSESQLAKEIADENLRFCERRGLIAGSHDFTVCTLDLNEVRARHEERTRTFDLF
jgi:hypothetical protein